MSSSSSSSQQSGGKLISFFFQLSNQVKLYHWQTRSYARHTASDKLHAEIAETSDKFMEVYAGKYGRTALKLTDAVASVKVYNLTDAQMTAYLSKVGEFLSKELPGLIDSAKDTDLLNLRDELLGIINQSLYLFGLE